MSVFASSAGLRSRTRATSSATLPTPTDSRALRVEPEGKVAKIRVGVVPTYERGARVAPRQLLAGDSEATVRAAAHRVHDLIVVRREFGRETHVSADFDIPQEAKASALRSALERSGDALDLLMVWRDPSAHQPEGRREALDEVDLEAR